MMMEQAAVASVEADLMTARECLLLADGLPSLAVARLKRMLQRLCFRVRVAGDAKQARALGGRCRPELVLVAAGQAEQLLWWLRARAAMPASGGRAGEAWQPVVIAIMQQQATPEEVLQLMMTGADECLAWPFDAAVLARRLATMQAFA